MAKSSLGEYFEGGSGGEVVPTGSYFETTPGGDLTGLGAMTRLARPSVGASPDGLGRLEFLPVMRDFRKLQSARRMPGSARRSQVSGLGQEPSPLEPAPPTTVPQVGSGVLMVAALAGLAVRGAAGYFVGKAAAPSAGKEKSYAMWGIPIGIVFGTLGLGVQAAVGISKRR